MLGPNLATAQFAIAGEILGAQVCIQTVSHTLATSGSFKFKLLTLKDGVPLVLLVDVCLQCCHAVLQVKKIGWALPI
jgi:hypothetical protein